MAQSLDGYLWVVSSLKKEKMRIRCLEDSHPEDHQTTFNDRIHRRWLLKAIVVICLFQLNLKLTSEDKTLTRHVFFFGFLMMSTKI